ncbi:hypothetical protein OE88DRAFT_204374 [Heliocybe sulcata]|uniref:Uncharacterized protein n=1 Tax=Heliocybe sulcata TaxID=5364 RepID=A0A5C3N154_9AGAM|nr:hypothetical protein OE88DRAFT_204374 [Heliocybe sulcata]
MVSNADNSTTFAGQASAHDTQICTFPATFDLVHDGAGAASTLANPNNESPLPTKNLITDRVPEYMNFPAHGLCDFTHFPSAITTDSWHSDITPQHTQQLQEGFTPRLVMPEYAPYSLEASPSAPLLSTKALPSEDLVDDIPPIGDDGQPCPSLSPYSMDIDYNLGAPLDTLGIDYDNPFSSFHAGLFNSECPPSPSTASTDSSFDSPLSTPLLTGLNLACLECVAHAHDKNYMCTTCGFAPLFSTEMGFEAGVEEEHEWMRGRIMGNDDGMVMDIDGDNRPYAILGLDVDDIASNSGAPSSRDFHSQRGEGNAPQAAFAL